MDIYTIHRTLDYQLSETIKKEYKDIWNRFPEIIAKYPQLTQDDILKELAGLLKTEAWQNVQDVWFERNASPDYWARLAALTGRNMLPEQKRLAKVRKLCAAKVEDIIEQLIAVSPTGFLDGT